MTHVHFECMLSCHAATSAWAFRHCIVFLACGMMKLLCFFVGWSLASAACGVHGRGQACRWNAGPVFDVATTEGSDDDVEGPPTPPGTRLPRSLQRLREMLDTLWDDGEEHVLYMMEGYLRIHLRAQESGPGTIEWQAWQEVLRYGSNQRSGYITPWWKLWLQGLLREWREEVGLRVEEGEVLALMQKHISPGYKRLEEWKQFLRQVQDMPSGVRKMVFYQVDRWLRSKLGDLSRPMVAYGGMMNDLLPQHFFPPGCSEVETELATDLSGRLIAVLEDAVKRGELDQMAWPQLEGAVRYAAMDVAVRADRAHLSEQVPVDDSWGDHAEREAVDVGLFVSRWLRRRLPADSETRARMLAGIQRALNQQLAEEARHFRRLHMAYEQSQIVGLSQVPNDGYQPTLGMEEELEIKDLVDQLLLSVSSPCSTRTPTVLQLLGTTSSSSSCSSAVPPALHHVGSLYQETEALRRWLNDFFEGSLETILEPPREPLGEEEGNAAPMGSDEGQDQGGQEGTEGDEEEGVDDDQVVLMQGSRRSSDKGRGRGRERSRSRSSGRRSRSRRTRAVTGTWSSASAHGWWAPGGTGLDGNNHRPWRRTPEGNPPSSRAEVSSRGDPTPRSDVPRVSNRDQGGTPRSSGAAGPSRGVRTGGVGIGTPVLPEPFEEHAWHVLLNMTDPHSAPEQLAYGLTSTATECVQASFEGMTARERERMHIALLRVLSRILMDVARAMTAAMMESQGDMIDVELEEDDHSTLMQGLPEHKAKKLKAASDKKEVTVPLTLDDILGSEFDKLSRNLLAAMDRMTVTESQRCAQALLCRLCEFYGIELAGTPTLPTTAQELVAGLVAYGADVDAPTVETALTAMDNYFVVHWWGMLTPHLPVPLQGAQVLAGDVDNQGTGDETFVGVTAHNMATGSGSGSSAPELPPSMRVIDLDLNATQGGLEPGLQAPTTECLGSDVHAVVRDRGTVEPAGERPSLAPEGYNEAERREMHAAMEKAYEEHKAAAFRDWEEWELAQSLSPSSSTLLEVQIRAGVRHSGGGRGTTQTMMFYLDPSNGERVDLQFSVGGSASLDVPPGDGTSARGGLRG